uniref:SET domain-containing protein n=1 Tax=Kalanchoe fedtschenkoi TaxID=63787 RepID=A0A7N1A4K0_KALFE
MESSTGSNCPQLTQFLPCSKVMAGQPKPHPTPCKCESPCTMQCVCSTKNRSCETDCGCPENCENRYRGCYCLTGQCRINGCPCFAAERECDPNLCRNCSICDGDGSMVGQPAHKRSCNNMNLQKGLSRRLFRGLSSEVSDWSLFNVDFIQKADFIGEYIGEVITNEDAERRQAKHPGSLHFFTLDDEYVVDAGQSIWSLLRFANHSTNKANCYAVCMLVKGRYRIAIFAKEDMVAESELLLDNGPQFAWGGTEKIELPPKAGTSRGRKGKKAKKV